MMIGYQIQIVQLEEDHDGVGGDRRYQWTIKIRSNETLESGYFYRWQMGGYINNFNSNKSRLLDK